MRCGMAPWVGNAHHHAFGVVACIAHTRPIPRREKFMDTGKELATPLELRPPVSIPYLPTNGLSWPLQLWAKYVPSHPSLVDHMDWTRALTLIVRGDAYPCPCGTWIQLSFGVLNHGVRGRTPTYLWVMGMAVCEDNDMAAPATIRAEKLRVCGPFLVH